MKRCSVLMLGFALVAPTAVLSVHAQSSVQATGTVAACPGEAALATAAGEQKCAFLFFWKQDDGPTRSAWQTLTTAVAARSGQASAISVNVTDAAQNAIVDRFAVRRSPMPLVVAVAPNGAVTGGFPLKISEKDVAGALVSKGMASCMKAAQARKIVLLCVLPAGAKDLPVGVRELRADAQYGPATEIVAIWGHDPAEAALLSSLKIIPSGTASQTALLVPPGSLLGVIEAPASKQPLIELLKSAKGGCCPGGKCGPGGCNPR